MRIDSDIEWIKIDIEGREGMSHGAFIAVVSRRRGGCS